MTQSRDQKEKSRYFDGGDDGETRVVVTANAVYIESQAIVDQAYCKPEAVKSNKEVESLKN